jgi:hypothetical protein
MKAWICLVALLGSAALVTPAYASDNQWTIAPSIDMAEKTSEFSIELFGTTIGNVARPVYKTISPSVGVSYGRFFGVVATDFTVAQGSYEDLTIDANGYNDNRGTYLRNETSLNAGYRVFEGKLGSANLFAGYLLGSADLSRVQTDYDNTQTPPFTYSSETAKFTETGPFIGVNFTHPVGKQALTINFAYAALYGELDDIGTNSTSTLPDHSLYKADAAGLSIGINWTGPIAQNMNYKIGYKFVDYAFKVKSIQDLVGGGMIPITPGSYVIREKIGSVYVGTTIYF